MDTTMAFIVSMGMTVTGQSATDTEQVSHQPAPAAQVQTDTRTAQTSKRIELTNNWLRKVRRSGMSSK